MTSDRDGSEERRLSMGALRVLALLALPVGGVALARAGTEGLAGALIGLALVALLFAGGAELTRLVVGRRPTVVVAVLVFGVVGRLLAYAAVLAGLARVGGVDHTILALATGLGVAVVLVHELRLLASMPRLFWIDAHTDRPEAVPNATRSQSL